MRKITSFIKRYWKNFDDTLINPPKERDDKKNFKGQNIYKRKFGEGPTATPEQVLAKTRTMEDEDIKMQPRNLRVKHFFYGMAFLAWYIGATLFIMYRMKGDDLDSLEKEVKAREKRKNDLGL